MTGLSSTTLPKPVNWQDFERSTRTLFEAVLDDPNTQMHGRTGQPQSGVDIWGVRKATGSLVGIQCKKSSDEITEKELKDEFKRARTFKPAIDEFILATTAPRDAKIQSVARHLTKRAANTSRPITVFVWGWEDIQESAALSQKAWRAFDPTFNPYAEQARLESQANDATTHQLLNKVYDAHQASVALIASAQSTENTPRHGQITAFLTLAKSGNPQTALEQLQRLRNAEWPTATASERYRLLTAIGVTQLALGNEAKAGQFLVDAYLESPTHRNAALNRAKGYLLLNDSPQVLQEARQLLQNDPSNSEAAGLLIQAIARTTTDSEPPLVEIPEQLRNGKDVLIARIEFYRRRKDSRWMQLAKDAELRHTDDRVIRAMSGESVLEEVLTTTPDAPLGGPITRPLLTKLRDAAEKLQALAKEVVADPSTLDISTIANAALSLRLLDRHREAATLLDDAIKRYPNSHPLLLQRAAVAIFEREPKLALSLLPPANDDVEVSTLRIEALLATGKAAEALTVLDATQSASYAPHIQLARVATRLEAYMKLGERTKARSLVDELITNNPADLILPALKIRLLRDTNSNEAKSLLEQTLARVQSDTPFAARVQLASEAYDCNLYEDCVRLLTGHVNAARDNPAIELLIAAALNGKLPNAARDALDSLTTELSEKPSFLRLRTVLALNTGDPAVADLLDKYLALRPADVQMLLRKAVILLHSGRDTELKTFLSHIQTDHLKGSPRLVARLAVFIARHGDAKIGIGLAYRTLLQNWDEADVHVAYHSAILLNPNIQSAIPDSVTIKESYVAFLSEGDQGKRKYRIENTEYPAFTNERLAATSDLAQALIGRKIGEDVVLGEAFVNRTVRVDEIKHVFLDALHTSLSEFNVRFPRSTALLSVPFDPEQPLKSFEDIARQRSEMVLEAINRYEKEGFPIAFIAPLIGEDPLSAWDSLPMIGKKVRVCRGSHAERADALNNLNVESKMGCVVDSVTAVMIKRLGAKSIVEAICGPIHTTQSVIDLLSSRSLEMRTSGNSQKGAISWQDGRVQVTSFSAEAVSNATQEREDEHRWAVENCKIVSAAPSKDLMGDLKKFAEQLPPYAIDPAIVADAHGLILVSDDLGYREWAQRYLKTSSAWLQSIFIKAKNEKLITLSEHCRLVRKLLRAGETYITLDAQTLTQQAIEANYEVTPEMKTMIEAIGGRSADVNVNIGVAAAFLDGVTRSTSVSKANRLASELYSSLSSGRVDVQVGVVNAIQQNMAYASSWTVEHGLSWIRGHSIGMPNVLDKM